jgi:hypothetical protein
VCLEGDFVVSVDAQAVVDPAVGAFDHRTEGLLDEAMAGFRLGHDIDGDTRFYRGVGDDRSMSDGRCDPFGLRGNAGNAARSCPSAGVTTAAIRTPAMSTSTWRWTPSTFFAPSNPRGRATRRISKSPGYLSSWKRHADDRSCGHAFVWIKVELSTSDRLAKRLQGRAGGRV